MFLGLIGSFLPVLPGPLTGWIGLLILFITSLINYSFSSAYISEYVESSGNVNSKNICTKIKNNINHS